MSSAHVFSKKLVTFSNIPWFWLKKYVYDTFRNFIYAIFLGLTLSNNASLKENIYETFRNYIYPIFLSLTTRGTSTWYILGSININPAMLHTPRLGLVGLSISM